MQLATERLLLPPLGRQHAEQLATVYADEEVARYIGDTSFDSAATAAQVAAFESVWKTFGYGQSAVIVRASAEFIGRVGLHPWPQWDEVAVAWVIARHMQGQGYAKEAVSCWLKVASRELRLPRVTAVIHPDNAVSRVLAERVGFTLHRTDVTSAGTQVLVYERLSTPDP